MACREASSPAASVVEEEEVDLWQGHAVPPHDVPIPAALRVKLYPEPPLRDVDPSRDRPTLRPFLVKGRTPGLLPAVLVFPGGGYSSLSDREGAATCRFFSQEVGVHAFLVHYRVQRRHPGPLLDARRAVQVVRARSAEWGVDPQRVGVMGFSAGGHLAGHLAIEWDCPLGREVDSHRVAAEVDKISQQSARPNFAALAYPVVSASKESTGLVLPQEGQAVPPYGLAASNAYSCVGDLLPGAERPIRHHGSMAVLLGSGVDDEQAMASVSLERLVAARMRGTRLSDGKEGNPGLPPFFIWHTADDLVVPAENSLRLASALLAAGAPVEFHVFERAGHGLGLGRPEDVAVALSKDAMAAVSPEATKWTQLLLSWFKVRALHDVKTPDLSA